MHARTAIRAIDVPMHALNGAKQLPVAFIPATRAPAAPGVVAAARHAQVVAQPTHFEVPPVLRDEREAFRFGREPEGSSFFSRSFSSRSCAFSRSSSRIRPTAWLKSDTAGFELDLPIANLPSRISFFQRDSMNGWMSRAAATSWVRIPGWLASTTAWRLNSKPWRLWCFFNVHLLRQNAVNKVSTKSGQAHGAALAVWAPVSAGVRPKESSNATLSFHRVHARGQRCLRREGR